MTSFPSDVLKWMKKNANPRKAVKLMKVCKYFQHQKFPYFLVKEFHTDFLETDILFYKTFKNMIIRIETMQEVPSNLWITEYFATTSSKFNVSKLLKNIAVCDAKELIFYNQKIYLKELEFLGRYAKYIELRNIVIKHKSSGSMSSFEDFLQVLPNIQKISFCGRIPSIKSQENLKKAVPSTLKSVEIKSCSPNYDISRFRKFMRDHKHISFKIPDSKQRQGAVEELIQMDFGQCKAAWMHFC